VPPPQTPAPTRPLSPSAFAHLFRDVTGKSPYQFVKELRLDRAREPLVDGKLPVAMVSKQIGYASSSHFISEFGRRFGATPRAYQDVQARQRLARVAVVGA
jgi:AraC-like DNA-binding protein